MRMYGDICLHDNVSALTFCNNRTEQVYPDTLATLAKKQRRQLGSIGEWHVKLTRLLHTAYSTRRMWIVKFALWRTTAVAVCCCACAGAIWSASPVDNRAEV